MHSLPTQCQALIRGQNWQSSAIHPVGTRSACKALGGGLSAGKVAAVAWITVPPPPTCWCQDCGPTIWGTSLSSPLQQSQAPASGWRPAHRQHAAEAAGVPRAGLLHAYKMSRHPLW